MLPILCALFVFLSGMLIINWQLWHMARSNYVETAAASTGCASNGPNGAIRPAKSAASTRSVIAGTAPLRGAHDHEMSATEWRGPSEESLAPPDREPPARSGS